MNYIAIDRHAHNPKVEGSNPSPATNPFNRLHGLEAHQKLPLAPNNRNSVVPAHGFRQFAAFQDHFYNLTVGLLSVIAFPYMFIVVWMLA